MIAAIPAIITIALTSVTIKNFLSYFMAIINDITKLIILNIYIILLNLQD